MSLGSSSNVPPQIPLPIVIVSVITHTASFYLFKAILLIFVNITFHLGADELNYVTVVFEALQYVFLYVGGLFVAIVPNKFAVLAVLLIASVVAQLLFYISPVLFLTKVSMYGLPAIFSTLKIGWYAYCLPAYYIDDCTKLKKVFLLILMAEIMGHALALVLVPHNILTRHTCGWLICWTYVMCLSLILGSAAALLFCSCQPGKMHYYGWKILSDSSTLYRIFAIFIPIIFIWICVDYAIERLRPMAKLVKFQLFSYSFNSENTLIMELMIIIMCGAIVYVALNIKYVAHWPIYTIAVGGLIIAVGLFLSSLLMYNARVYEVKKPPAHYCSLYLSTSCYKNDNFSLNSTEVYLENPATVFHQYWKVAGSKVCQEAIYTSRPDEKNSTQKVTNTICLNEYQSYILYVKCPKCNSKLTGNSSISSSCNLIFLKHFDTRRDLFGRTKLCVLPKNSSPSDNYHIKIESRDKFGLRYTFMSNDNFTCRFIKEGFYQVTINFTVKNENTLFQYGALYVMTVGSTYLITEINKPMDISVWKLVGVFGLLETGKIVIIVFGLYVVYSQSQTSVRILAVGVWWLYVSAGRFIMVVSSSLARVMNETALYSAGLMVILLTAIFLAASLRHSQWIFICRNYATPISSHLTSAVPSQTAPTRAPVVTVSIYKHMKSN